MDIVLELFDNYILDDIYAKLFPLTQSPLQQQNSLLPTHTPNLVKSAWQSFISSPFILSLSSINTTISNNETLSSNLGSPASAWPRDFMGRQLLSLTVLTLIGIHVLYFLVAGLSYQFIFNHEMMRHPRFLPNQVRKEIQASLRSFPGMIALTIPFFLCEVRGYTKLYDKIDDYGWGYFLFSFPLFLVFTDYCIYWIHRWLHVPWLYKRFHKPHHKWIGKVTIHDSDMITGHPLENIINGPAHHTLHHLYFVCNYGQYFTFADRAGGSYRHPDSSLDPLLEVKSREGISAEQEARDRSEKERQGDNLAEEWEQKILESPPPVPSGDGKPRIIRHRHVDIKNLKKSKARDDTTQSDSNPFKTSSEVSEPIDSLLGPILRPGYALQISSSPGLYVERLLIGLIENVTRVGKEIMIIDMQNKLTPPIILILKLNELPGSVQTHPDVLSTKPIR
ncbi:hypothetical protein Clacol_002313 [Clathrus columnatus]|uniref:Fatty acid hydroxylase domain-containing protein n=1 Tax=Clathrus columnatus TaxID=1419009 RepID=A0AAV5A525_9AGAM|nr:hypothetical protein Clacol_002313 [Clathrus columnatus]